MAERAGAGARFVAFAATFGLAVGFVPLASGPGYELGLLVGLVLPTAAAAFLAVDALRAGGGADGQGASPFAVAARALGLAAAGVGAVLAASLAHAARTRACAPLQGSVWVLLGAGVGTALGALAGVVAAEVVRASGAARRPRLAAALLGASFPLASMASGLVRFVRTPAVHAFDPFVGFFGGTLYDTVIEPGPALATFRAGTGLAAVAVLGVLAALERGAPGPGGRARLRIAARGAPRRLGLALAAAGTFGAAYVAADGRALGHVSTRASMTEALGASTAGARCDVVYPASLSAAEGALLAKDCDDDLAEVEAALGARGPARVTAFFFRDEAEKRRLMGAAHTYVAKPWREEVYLQLAPYPHPVLPHELAHVVAGSFGEGPFRVAGALGGLVPDPGRIEGVAVAAAPDDGELEPLDWCRAMHELGLLPPLARVFSLGFLGGASSTSYTVAGAFVRHLADAHGMDRVRAWYGGARFDDAFGVGFAAAEAAFRAEVAARPLPARALEVAKARFDRSGLFGRVCPHEVDALRRDAEACVLARRHEEALAKFEAVLAKDPLDWGAAAGRAAEIRRRGARDEGEQLLVALAADVRAPRTVRDRAEETLADLELATGDAARALPRYDALLARVLDEDALRTLEVKRLAAADPRARAFVAPLLVGDGDAPPEPFASGFALGRAVAAPRGDAPSEPSEPSEPNEPNEPNARGRAALAAYLVARQLVTRARWDDAAAALAAIDLAALPTPRLARETVRLGVVAACARGAVLPQGATDARAAFAGDVARAHARATEPATRFDEAPGRLRALGRLARRCAPRD